MKTLLIILTLLATTILAGCTGPLAESRADRSRRIKQITEMERRLIVEDWDVIWLNDRPTYLTQWHPRLGMQ